MIKQIVLVGTIALGGCATQAPAPNVMTPAALPYYVMDSFKADCLYSANRKGRLFRGEIDHPPWTLTNANWTVKKNSMCSGLGVDLIGQPHLLYAQPITVRAWPATRC